MTWLRRSLLIYGLVACLTAIITMSCGQNPAGEASRSPETAAEATNFRVAMLLTGSRDDGSWSEAGYQGLQLIAQEHSASVDFQEYLDEAAASEAALRTYAEQGYDFIIGHSGSYIEPAERVAAEFPRTKFAVVTTYPGNNRNLGAVAFRAGEAGYLTGALAAMVSETRKVGYMVGYDYPVYQEEAALFQRGVEQTAADVTAYTEFLQTWTDPDKGAAVARQLIAEGVDVLAINADESGLGAIEEIHQNHPDVKIIGWTTDQHSLAPGQVLTSVLQDIPTLILEAATLVQQGRWEGKLYKFGLKEQIYDFAPFRESITPEQEEQFSQWRAQVMAGEIDITP